MLRPECVSRWLTRGAGVLFASTLLTPLALTGANASPGVMTQPEPSTAQAQDENQGPSSEQTQQEGFNALVFSKTEAFRHDSIPAGIAAIEQLGADNGFEVTATEDAGAFTADNLAQYDVVVWLSTTGDVLNDAQQEAFEGYIADGGGYAGIHAASDTEYDWEWYGDLVGAYFDNHPPGTPEGDIKVADTHHPSTQHLPDTWTRTDEWYSFQENPRGNVHVLAALDEQSYDAGDGGMGADHPIAWCQNFDGGRSWYTGGGHTTESYSEPEFLEHLLGGIQTAAGATEADCTETVGSSFDQVTLAQGEGNTGEPMAMAVLPEGDVVHTSRDGRVFYTTADASTSLAGEIPVYNHDEDGLQGVAVDPNFAENRWLYAYYAPPLDTPAGEAPDEGSPEDFEPFEGYNQLSRFTLSEDGELDLDSEQQILQVSADRGLCCHAGGEIDFDADGNLLLSTGDDTNPFASDGYTPIDERENRNPAYDAQRSSANTNDLRGKLLRISVGEGGDYSIPDGNLFEEGTENTRPEIYAMGFRNPFRFSVDHETGWIYLGDYGPDAGSADESRGPAGTVEFNLIKEAGNYGWPYCIGDNEPFVDYDFGSGESGEAFDCENPVNESPNNTGLTELPPAQPAWAPYDGDSNPKFGDGGESPMGGPTYHFDPELDSEYKWPEYYDGKNFSYEWDRGWIHEFVVDDDGGLVDVLPTLDWMNLVRPMNVEFGPDGTLYVLDYGSGYFGGAEDSALYRIDYVGDNPRPVADLSASPTNGTAPLTVEFDGSGSSDPQDRELSYAWDFDDDGNVDSTEATPSHTYEQEGVHTARLSVTVGEGENERTGTATVNITAGNTAPEISLEVPANGGIFGFGEQVPFEVTVTDPEDGEIDCDQVQIEYILGHDNHGHPLSEESGCEGVIATPADEGHGLDADVFGVINASYTDQGGNDDVPPLTGDDESVLRLRHQQAEFFDDAEGVTVDSADGAHGGAAVGEISAGDWIAFDPMNFVGIDGVSFRYAAADAGGTIEVRKGAVDGELVATVDLSGTDGAAWDTSEVAEVTDPGGSEPVYFVFTGGADESPFDLDEIHFHGEGVSGGDDPPGCEPGEVEEGYTALFDGTQDSLDAWNMAGPGSFELTDDCTAQTVGGMGLLWYPEQFGDYSLKLDWKMAGDDNSGVFVGFPDPGDDPWVAVDQGYEVQIDATDEPDRTTGAIYTFQGADQEARDQVLNPPGEWNSYEIVVQGQNIKVYLNDVLINDFDSTHPDRDLTSGLIGLQNHGDEDDVAFRNVRIADIADVVTFDTVLAEVDQLRADEKISVSVARQVQNHLGTAERFVGRDDGANAERAFGRAIAAAEKVEDDQTSTELVARLEMLQWQFSPDSS